MARYSAAVRTSAGSTTLPIASLYAGTSNCCWLKEVHVYNTTSTEVSLKVSRLDSAGTPGSAQTDCAYEQDGGVAVATFNTTHTVGPTIDETITAFPLGAAIGSGIILTFGDNGIRIPAGTANGVGVVVATGTGQICDVTMVWEE